jgi:hypothetical protein
MAGVEKGARNEAETNFVRLQRTTLPIPPAEGEGMVEGPTVTAEGGARALAEGGEGGGRRAEPDSSPAARAAADPPSPSSNKDSERRGGEAGEGGGGLVSRVCTAVRSSR